MKLLLLAGGLTLMLINGVAFAQTTVANGADATIAGPGMTMGKAANGPLKYVNIQDNDLATSKLIGVGIFNKQNDNIGEISDVIIGDGKSVIGIVASVGGFLGLAESYVVLDPSSIALSNENSEWKAYVDTTKEDLTKAPRLDYSKMKK